ncbi:Zn-dependent hydrolase [Bowdeniella nasicola]|uniref:Zn-dependent hydrolase n=1 Tax=Bowdeniella nasicola TaxID=208480 RepID=A0A1Q5Q3U3_9ACTO|nr:MBL fold metallo-hydrolase [Bowdeniella nasicola]OKL54471.1 Zn-dependent hydrolase [Bowdeniella nasicola]
MTIRIDHTVTSGTFELDGGSWDVDNNVWILGDDETCVVIDAPHNADAIIDAVAGREVQAILLTHAHSDHVDVVLEVREKTGAPILMHPDDQVLWELSHPGEEVDGHLADGDVLTLAGSEIHVLHTPGHAPGAVCFYVPGLGCVFSGDTLFNGGPGATGRSYSDYPTIVNSIRTKLFTLPPNTVVHTGHGDDTTILAEADNVPDEKPE